MTPDQIRLVQESFRLVLPIAEQAAAGAERAAA